MLFDAQLNLVQQVLNVLHAEVFGPRTISLAPVQRLTVAQLELDAVGPCIERCIHQAFGQRQRTIVIVSGLGNHKDALAAQRNTVKKNRSHWIFVRHEVTPLDSKRKFWV